MGNLGIMMFIVQSLLDRGTTHSSLFSSTYLLPILLKIRANFFQVDVALLDKNPYNWYDVSVVTGMVVI